MPAFHLFLLSPGRAINQQGHTQTGCKKPEGTLNKQRDGNNSNKKGTGAIPRLKHVTWEP